MNREKPKTQYCRRSFNFQFVIAKNRNEEKTTMKHPKVTTLRVTVKTLMFLSVQTPENENLVASSDGANSGTLPNTTGESIKS